VTNYPLVSYARGSLGCWLARVRLLSSIGNGTNFSYIHLFISFKTNIVIKIIIELIINYY
jgi:hypothetical protein